MENASKALIIAGAILLAILIIGLGMVIYQKASGVMSDGTSGLESTKISTYNAEFEQYNGAQTGSNARALYQKLQEHNRNNADDTSLQIACEVKTTSVEQTNAKNTADTDVSTLVEPGDTAPTLTQLTSIKAGNKYYVSFQYSKAGYVSKCTIQLLK